MGELNFPAMGNLVSVEIIPIGTVKMNRLSVGLLMTDSPIEQVKIFQGSSYTIESNGGSVFYAGIVMLLLLSSNR